MRTPSGPLWKLVFFAGGAFWTFLAEERNMVNKWTGGEGIPPQSTYHWTYDRQYVDASVESAVPPGLGGAAA